MTNDKVTQGTMYKLLIGYSDSVTRLKAGDIIVVTHTTFSAHGEGGTLWVYCEQGPIPLEFVLNCCKSLCKTRLSKD